MAEQNRNVVSFRVSEQTFEALNEAAARLNRTRHEVAKQMFELFFEKCLDDWVEAEEQKLKIDQTLERKLKRMLK